ncbi:MAG: T9SS type A sorting domain-containing protein, partial [Phycisphaeraceae bacterium]|nr:T9SS type A sorting domain-containing protein [Phycisphaeraceae bacterium]
GIQQVSELSVYDVLGQCILPKSPIHENVSLNINNAPAGIYFLHLQSSGSAVVLKMIKE